ncbi:MULTISPECIES: MFS transporter [Trueperella]|uniref:MFS family permease n=1 Tax=Trueperella abortisuis TaxID=445930 RepID=A0ABT9PGS5_9ACTO|nr:MULTISPECIES: MFS transporter [Trueperella]MCI7305940.1 MFS transporter [Trueperella sp.]MDP9831345.1 MFS family permease [Trueperella abortisuis]MDP9833514.1 MFS family permease [Trueperella abortisuis]MDY5404167.1 MFS transporter [Trueperella sp.]
MSRTFESFEVRNYRYFFAGALVSNVGTWIFRVAQDWLVLTELTAGSSSALGFVTALQFLAIPFLAPYAGGIVDRLDKRKVLMVTQLLLMLNAVAMWLVVYTGVVQLWHIYALAFMQGLVVAFDNPARQAFVPEIVSQDRLANAVGLNSTSFNAARLIGPGLAGFLIAAFNDDVAPALLINALSFVGMFWALIAMKTSELHPSPRAEKKGAIRGGFRYVKSKPDIIVLLVIVFMLGTFGMNFQIYNATMATEVFGKGSGEYGLLGTIMAIGTLAGALMAARRQHPRLRTILISLMAFSVATIGLAFTPSYLAYSILLVPAGFFALTVMTSANAAVQMSSDPLFRGRVMAIYMAIFLGGTPLGAPIVGWLGDAFGPRSTLLVGGGLNLITVLGILAYFTTKGMRLRLHFSKYLPGIHAEWTVQANEKMVGM